MRTASVRDLRTNFPKLERWLADGEDVQITKRRKVVARLVPAVQDRQAVQMPNFTARVRATFGTRRLTAASSVALRRTLRGDR